MPDITITEAQAAALARGENITLSPPKPDPVVKHYVVVRDEGGVLEYSTVDGSPQPWTCVRQAGTILTLVGTTSSFGHDFKATASENGDTVIEVKA